MGAADPPGSMGEPSQWFARIRWLSIGLLLAVSSALNVLALATSWSPSAWGAWVLALASGVLIGVWARRGARSSSAQDQAAYLLKTLGHGDLTETGRGQAGLSGGLFAAVGEVAGRLSVMVADVRSNVAVSLEMTGTLATANEKLASRTERQAAALEQTSATVLEVAEAVRQNAENAALALNTAIEAWRVAGEGAGDARESMQAIGQIKATSQLVGEIVTVIDSIAMQTNILALNAAVEAAHAGDAGRGFGVVAGDIRMLAQKCAEAARDIRNLLDRARGEVSDGVRTVSSVQDKLQALKGFTEEVQQRMSQVAAASKEQAAATEQIAQAVQELDTITTENARMVDSSAEAAARLRDRTARVMKALSHIRLQQGTADEAIALVHRALEAARQCDVEAAIAAINDPAQAFRDRDMYVFVIDREGRHFAQAADPKRIGTYVRDFKGVDGVALMRDILVVIDGGGGWVDYELNNPVTQKHDPKTTYFRPLGQDLIVGCGVYRTANTAA